MCLGLSKLQSPCVLERDVRVRKEASHSCYLTLLQLILLVCQEGNLLKNEM